MKNSNIYEEVKKHFDEALKDVNKEWSEKIQPKIDEAKKNIKHPLFNYAFLSMDTLSVTYKRKSFKDFFRYFGKRIVFIRMPAPTIYATMPSYNSNSLISTKENNND